MSERWWKSGPVRDEDGQEYWSIRRSPIGLAVAERVYDEHMADRIVSLHGEHQALTSSTKGLQNTAGEQADGRIAESSHD